MSEQHNTLAKLLLEGGHVDEAMTVLKDGYSSQPTEQETQEETQEPQSHYAALDLDSPGFNDLLAPILWHLVVVEGREIDLPKGYKLLRSSTGKSLWLEFDQGPGRAPGVKEMRSPTDHAAYRITDRIAGMLDDSYKPLLKKGVLLWDRNRGKVVLLNKSFGPKLLKTIRKVTPKLEEYFTFERAAKVDDVKAIEEVLSIENTSTKKADKKNKTASPYIHRTMRYKGPATEEHLRDILFDIRMRVLGVQQFAYSLVNEGEWHKDDFEKWEDNLDDVAYSLMDIENKLTD